MNKEVLPYGCVVEFRDGTQWLRVGNTDALVGLIDGEYEGYNTLEEYDDELNYYNEDFGRDEFSKQFDIVKVYTCVENRDGDKIRRFLSEDNFVENYCELVCEKSSISFNNNYIMQQIEDLKSELDNFHSYFSEKIDKVLSE